MDSDQTKLFVGGISRETTEEDLKQHFCQYGEVLEAVVAKDRSTGLPRGFGFVRFSEFSSAYEALSATNHHILNRKVEVKKAVPRFGQPQSSQQHPDNLQQNSGMIDEGSRCNGPVRTKKIFVGGLASDLTKEEFRTYFEKFGSIVDCVVMHDSVTNKPRGFGFVTFDSEEAVEMVIQKSFHELNTKRVEVKRAIPKDGTSSSNGALMWRAGANVGSEYVIPQCARYPHNGMNLSTVYYPAQVYCDIPAPYPVMPYYQRYATMANGLMPWHDPMINLYGYYPLAPNNFAMYSSYQNFGMNSPSTTGIAKLNQVCENGRAMINEKTPRFDGSKIGNGDTSTTATTGKFNQVLENGQSTVKKISPLLESMKIGNKDAAGTNRGVGTDKTCN